MRTSNPNKSARVDESSLELYDMTGARMNLKQFRSGDVVVARVNKKMNEKEFREFFKAQSHIFRIFDARNITLIFCPEWVDFKKEKEL